MFLSCLVSGQDFCSVLRKLYGQGAAGATHRRSAPWSAPASSPLLEAADNRRIAGAGQRRSSAALETCTKSGLNLGAWPASMPVPSGAYTVGRKRVSLSQLCGGRARAGSVRLPAVFSDGGACGVAAVCRRPVKDPPRQFGERAFTGLPWMPTWFWGLVGQVPVCAATSGVVYAPAPAALPAASKAQPRRPSLRPLLF